jgi:hypothetical protein
MLKADLKLAGIEYQDVAGRFLPGTAPGPGNPMARRTAQYRRAIREAVSPEDLVQIIKVLMDKALAGDVQAAREVLDRVLGKAKVRVEVEERSASVAELRASLLSMLATDPGALHRTLGIPATAAKVLPSCPHPTN